MITRSITLKPKGMSDAPCRPKIEGTLEKVFGLWEGWVGLHRLQPARCVADTNVFDKMMVWSTRGVEGRCARPDDHSEGPTFWVPYPASRRTALRARPLREPNAGGIPRFLSEIVADKPAGTGVGSNAPAEAGGPPA